MPYYIEGPMPTIPLYGLKNQITSLTRFFKQITDSFRTAKDVYPELLGIDFDDTSLLVIQLRNPLGAIRVVNMGVAPLSSGVIIDDAIVEKTTAATVLKTLLEKKGVRSKTSALAIPGTKVMIKQIKLNAPLTDFAAETRAWAEARRAFPDLVKNMYLDFVQTAAEGPEKTKQYILTLVIARKDDVTPRVDILQQAGLVTKIVDVDYYALARAYRLIAQQLPEKHAEKYLAMIHFNPHHLLCVVMHQKAAIYYTRQVYVGDALIPLVRYAMQFEVPVQKSKLIADAMPLLPLQLPAQTSNTDDQMTDEQKSHIVLSVRRLFQAFYSEQPGHVIDCIALTGRCALIPELPEHLEKMLDIPVTVVNPLASLKMRDLNPSDPLFQWGPAFTLCCGLAMRGMPVWT